METGIITPALVFMMKYFFDVEKEITQQLLLTCQLHLNNCKDAVTSLCQVAVEQKYY
jgi:hypothetical protein